MIHIWTGPHSHAVFDGCATTRATIRPRPARPDATRGRADRYPRRARDVERPAALRPRSPPVPAKEGGRQTLARRRPVARATPRRGSARITGDRAPPTRRRPETRTHAGGRQRKIWQPSRRGIDRHRGTASGRRRARAAPTAPARAAGRGKARPDGGGHRDAQRRLGAGDDADPQR